MAQLPSAAGRVCPAWASVLPGAGCAADGSDCVLLLNLTNAADGSPIVDNFELLAPLWMALETARRTKRGDAHWTVLLAWPLLGEPPACDPPVIAMAPGSEEAAACRKTIAKLEGKGIIERGTFDASFGFSNCMTNSASCPTDNGSTASSGARSTGGGFNQAGRSSKVLDASCAIVGFSKKSRNVNSVPSASLLRISTCAARIESPPSAKKSS